MEYHQTINPHFEDYILNWDYKTYLLVGGYGSSKSYHTALKIVFKLLQEKRTALVVREVYSSIRESCFSLFRDIASSLGDLVEFTVTPMAVRFQNGSRIIFKGLDKPEKLKSINNVSIIWIEECSEIKYDGFKELLGRLRHPTLSLHILLSTNPVSRSNWVYQHFFNHVNDERLYKERVLTYKDVYYHHSVADDNRFLPKSYFEQLDEMKSYDPDLYRVARLGHFGINGTRVLPQFEVMPHAEVVQCVAKLKMRAVGMDFGFENSYNAVVRMAIDDVNKWLYLYWEYYKNKMTDDETADALSEFVRSHELIKADSAEPKAISYFRKRGLNMVATHKISRLENTRKMKRFKRIICSDRLVHCIDELQDLTYAKDRNGEIIPDQFTIDPHTFSAMWYGLDDYDVAGRELKIISFGKGVWGI